MIHSEGGNVRLSGTIEEMTADVCFALASVVSELKELRGFPEEVIEYAIKTSVKDILIKNKKGHVTRMVTDQSVIDILGGDKDK